MARLEGVELDRIEPATQQAFNHQIERWGEKLGPYEIYARCPSIFHAVIGMWEGIGASGLLDRRLTTLINRRVASLNGCLF